jgi:Flp pilus assembly protein TadG
MRQYFFRIDKFFLCCKGAAAVEFVLLFPIFAAVIFGGYDLGRYIFLKNELTVATQEAGRFAMIRSAASPAPATPELVSQIVFDNLNFNNPDNVRVTVLFIPDNAPGSQAIIQAQSSFSALGDLIEINALQLNVSSNIIFIN